LTGTIGGSVIPRFGCACISGKPSLHEVRGENVTPSASELGPYASKEVVKVGGKQAGDLYLGVVRAGCDECHQDQSIWKVFGLEIDDVE
jgi:hypothetical protein